MPKADGGPAFPKPDVIFNGSYEYGPFGMTLRQWYAGNAPASIEAMIDDWSLKTCAEKLGIEVSTWNPGIHYLQLLTKMRFEYADAMIAESEKE